MYMNTFTHFHQSVCVCDLSVDVAVRGECARAAGTRPSRLAPEIDDKKREAGGRDGEFWTENKLPANPGLSSPKHSKGQLAE